MGHMLEGDSYQTGALSSNTQPVFHKGVCVFSYLTRDQYCLSCFHTLFWRSSKWTIQGLRNANWAMELGVPFSRAMLPQILTIASQEAFPLLPSTASLPGFTLLLIKPPTWLWLTTAAGWKWSASGPRYPPHGVITLCEILGWEVSSHCPSLSLFSHLYPGGSCVITASLPYPHPHPSWSSGENHLLSWLSGDFF